MLEILDPRKAAKAVKKGELEFNSKLRLTLTLANGQKYSVDPVHPDQTYPLAPGVPRPPFPPPPPRNGRPPPPKPPKPPPKPPPQPLPPTNEKPPRPPKPPKPPKKSASALEQFAAVGVVVARVETDGLNGEGWSVPKGRYVVVLTELDGKPVAAWIDGKGKYVLSTDQVYFVSWSH